MITSTVDVIIPVFNGERYIQAAIQSVQQQTFPVARIIVADDGSTDRTGAIVTSLQQSDSRIHLLKLPHAGVSAARNAGITTSSATYIAFLDADDLWLPEKLALQIAAFADGGQEVGFVHSSYFCMNDAGELLPEQLIFPPEKRGDIFRPLLMDNYVLSGSASSVLVRRDILDKAGHFDEQLFHGEDWDLWLKLAHISKVDFTPEAVVGIRVHDQSAQRRAIPARSISFFQQQLLVYGKWQALLLGDPGFKDSLRRRAIEAVLPLWRSPTKVLEFYKTMAASKNPLEHTLFSSFADFAMQFAQRLFAVIGKRIKHKVGIHD